MKSTQQLKILVAEDEQDLREILISILKRMGFNPTAVENGQVAFDQFVQNDYDLIISDMKMPVMDGMKLLETIRSSQMSRQPYFVFLTGGVDIDAAQMDRLKNMSQGILAKPFKKEAIAEVLMRLFPDAFAPAA